MAVILSDDSKLYVGTTLTTADTEVAHETALALAAVYGEVDVVNISSSRSISNYKTRAKAYVINVPGKKEAGIDIEGPYDPADASVGNLEDAYEAGTELYLAALTDAHATTGAQGLAGNFYISEFSTNTDSGGHQSYSAKAVPGAIVGIFEQTT